MKKAFLALSILFCLLVVTAIPAQDSRGLTLLVKQLDPGNRVGKQHLLLIAVDNYKFWPPLKNPVRDARELKEILTTRYFIDEVTELYNDNATKANIIRVFEACQKKLDTNDSLLVYYAGHGHLDKVTNTGFWIPVNAGTDKYEQANWLPNMQVRGLISGIRAIHLLVISDSCFSGDLLNSSRALPDEINSGYFKRAYARNSRQILTSGASENVPDESEFSRMLKIALRKNNSAYFDPLMLFTEIRLGVQETMPMFGNLKDTGHQEGASFLLFLKDQPPPETARKEEPKKEEPKKVEPVKKEEPKKTEAVKKEESGKVEPAAVTRGFTDEFDGPELDRRWRWLSEDPAKWSLKSKPGSLTITTQKGDVVHDRTDARNLLLARPVSPNFTIETKVQLSPNYNYQQAGIIVHFDHDNYVKLVFQFSFNRVVTLAREVNGKYSNQDYSLGNFNAVYLRLVRYNASYSGFYSTDGRQYYSVGQTSHNSGYEPRVGLIALNSDSESEIPASFDYFKIYTGDRPVEATAIKDEVKKEEKAATAATGRYTGPIVLKARKATLVKKGSIKIEEAVAGENIGYWDALGDQAQWQADIPEDGEYAVFAHYSCDNRFFGSTVKLTVEDQSFEFQVLDTSAWASYRTYKIGKIRLKAGKRTVMVQATSIPTKFVMNLAELRFEKN